MSINIDKLSIVNLDDIKYPTRLSNMPFDEFYEFRNSDYISSVSSISYDDFDKLSGELIQKEGELEEAYDDEGFKCKLLKKYSELYSQALSTKEGENDLIFNGINLGNGKMDYIENMNDKIMITNAWQAITETKTWNFVSQDIDSFIWSTDPRIEAINDKMIDLGYDKHLGCTFGYTMRNIQYLAQNGEEKFKKLFLNKPEEIHSEFDNFKFLKYTGGF